MRGSGVTVVRLGVGHGGGGGPEVSASGGVGVGDGRGVSGPVGPAAGVAVEYVDRGSPLIRTRRHSRPATGPAGRRSLGGHHHDRARRAVQHREVARPGVPGVAAALPQAVQQRPQVVAGQRVLGHGRQLAGRAVTFQLSDAGRYLPARPGAGRGAVARSRLPPRSAVRVARGWDGRPGRARPRSPPAPPPVSASFVHHHAWCRCPARPLQTPVNAST